MVQSMLLLPSGRSEHEQRTAPKSSGHHGLGQPELTSPTSTRIPRAMSRNRARDGKHRPPEERGALAGTRCVTREVGIYNRRPPPRLE